ncbi:glycosyltransferase [Metabacillus halosaccharovorans]|uniref:glycosyltransferase n=1 Tax=Metabacillus halosaccharovorans TaxID=930124 RepID=UPI00203D6D94|nr:glycosyltransferase [Metabacillus halosaccharovorans]MCM3443677.1 glycosyltransferase [Metabacillus halosaccharovorans]
MRILHLSTNYMPVNNCIEHGGTERIVFNLARFQVEDKNNTVYVFGKEETFIKGAICKGIYPENIQDIRNVDWEEYEMIMNNSNQYIINFIEENEIDIIHDHFGVFTTSYEAKKLLLKDKKIKILVSIYGLPDNPYYKEIYANFINLRTNFKNQIRCFCVSSDHFNLFSQTHEIDGYIYNGIDTSSFLFGEKKEDFFLSLASLVPGKGHDRCLDWAKENNKKLLIVGKTDPKLTDPLFFNKIVSNTYNGNHLLCDNDFSSYQNIINEFENNRIIYLESINDKLKKLLLAKASALFMLVRWREPFAITILEALASGTPVIGSDVGSIREGIDKETGVIIKSDNEISNAVSFIRTVKPQKCYSRVLAKFDYKKMSKKYIEEYVKLYNNKKIYN